MPSTPRPEGGTGEGERVSVQSRGLDSLRQNFSGGKASVLRLIFAVKLFLAAVAPADAEAQSFDQNFVEQQLTSPQTKKLWEYLNQLTTLKDLKAKISKTQLNAFEIDFPSELSFDKIIIQISNGVFVIKSGDQKMQFEEESSFKEALDGILEKAKLRDFTIDLKSALAEDLQEEIAGEITVEGNGLKFLLIKDGRKKSVTIDVKERPEGGYFFEVYIGRKKFEAGSSHDLYHVLIKDIPGVDLIKAELEKALKMEEGTPRQELLMGITMENRYVLFALRLIAKEQGLKSIIPFCEKLHLNLDLLKRERTGAFDYVSHMKVKEFNYKEEE